MKKQLLKTVYINKKKSNDKFDKIILVSKTEEGKNFQLIEKPVITYHITKPEEWDGKYVRSIAEDRTIEVTAYNTNIIKSIVDNLNDPNLTAMYQMATRNRTQDSWRVLNDIHLDGRVHGSDINIEDFYIQSFLKKYEPNENFIGYDKSYVDIEVDGTHIDGFPEAEEALAPVNLISYYSDSKNKGYLFALKYETDTYREFKENQEQVIADLVAKYEPDFPGFQLEFLEYDNEATMILDYLNLVNNDDKPDYCGAWNLDFDFPTLYNRLTRLGFQPEEAFSSQDFPYKNAYYRLDTKADSIADRNSSFITSSYTTWIDQLSLYANINKPMGVLESYKLDDIAERELGEKKVDLTEDEDVGTDITNIFLRNYTRFIVYGIQDVMLLAKLERKIKHLDLLNQISTMTATRTSHALKKTVCLRNLADMYYRKVHGMILSNNRAKLFPHSDEKREGAFVGDPNLIDFVGIMTGSGERSNKIFKNVTDLDLASLYPNLQIAFNISPETFVAPMRYRKIDSVTGREEDLTDLLVDSYNSRDAINFGKEFLGLPSYKEMEEHVNAALAASN